MQLLEHHQWLCRASELLLYNPDCHQPRYEPYRNLSKRRDISCSQTSRAKATEFCRKGAISNRLKTGNICFIFARKVTVSNLSHSFESVGNSSPFLSTMFAQKKAQMLCSHRAGPQEEWLWTKTTKRETDRQTDGRTDRQSLSVQHSLVNTYTVSGVSKKNY